MEGWLWRRGRFLALLYLFTCFLSHTRVAAVSRSLLAAQFTVLYQAAVSEYFRNVCSWIFRRFRVVSGPHRMPRRPTLDRRLCFFDLRKSCVHATDPRHGGLLAAAAAAGRPRRQQRLRGHRPHVRPSPGNQGRTVALQLRSRHGPRAPKQVTDE